MRTVSYIIPASLLSFITNSHDHGCYKVEVIDWLLEVPRGIRREGCASVNPITLLVLLTLCPTLNHAHYRCFVPMEGYRLCDVGIALMLASDGGLALVHQVPVPWMSLPKQAILRFKE